jgi:alkylation response protein AidB-like acyl-CoA dehydrogenase
MDATLSEEQGMLADTAGRLASALGPGSIQELEDYDPTRASRELAGTGMLALAVPEELGGAGAGCFEAALVSENLARRLVPVPYIGPVLALELLVAAGDEKAVAQALSGERRVTIGLDASLQVLAGGAGNRADRADRGELGDAGTGAVAWEASGATDAVVAVASGTGWQLGLAALAGATEVPCADLTRQIVRLPTGEPEPGADHELEPDQRERWEAFALSLLCADMVGAMDGALAMAVEHAKSRVQFGRPIGSFQALQHLIADQLVDLEASRSATYYSAWAADGRPAAEALRAARAAKSYVSRAARSVTEAVLQVHGGIGQTWESLAHAYLRRVLLDRATLGDEAVHVARLGDQLRDGSAG